MSRFPHSLVHRQATDHLHLLPVSRYAGEIGLWRENRLAHLRWWAESPLIPGGTRGGSPTRVTLVSAFVSSLRDSPAEPGL